MTDSDTFIKIIFLFKTNLPLLFELIAANILNFDLKSNFALN